MYNENGYQPTQKIDDIPQQTEFYPPQDFYYSPPPTPPRKKSKLPLILVIVALVLFAACAAIFLLSGKTSSAKSSYSTKPTVIYAKVNDDGTAYIPLFNGESIVIHDDVEDAVLTADRKHVVVLLDDGTLYVTDTKQSSRSVLSEKCYSFAHVRNDGFFYNEKSDSDDSIIGIYRVLFSDLSQQYLGDNVQSSLAVATNNTSVLFSATDGCIFTMPATSTHRTKVGSYGDADDVELEAISDDGELSVWVTEKDEVQTIVLNEGDERVTLGEVDYKYNYTYAAFTADQGMLVICNSYSDRVWIKIPGQEVVEAKMGAELASSTLYTSSGYINHAQTSEVTSLYVSVEADTGSNIYQISLNGDRERILSKVSQYRISNGYIIYLDTDSTLYYAKLDNSSISEPTKIAGNVDILETNNSGLYVYYMKNVDDDDDVGDYYCYKIGTDDAERIATDVGCLSYGSFGWAYASYSTDGSTVFFFKDMEKIPGTYTNYGTLLVWHYGEDSASKIASEVLPYSLNSALATGNIDPKSFVFTRYSSVDSDENILVNWIYYDGSETTKFASDVIR